MIDKMPRVGLGVLVVKDGKILIGKRIGSHGANTWQLPGGHLEFGETWEQCAKREVMEESGIQIDHVEFAGVTNDIMQGDEKHYITIFMKAKYLSGDVRILEPEKCLDWEWFAWESVPSPQFPPLRQLIMSGYHPLNTLHNKLVRDHIPQRIESHGEIAKWHTAGETEYKQALQAKLIEEVQEYLEDENTEELGDILEVIHSLSALRGVNREQLQYIQKEKYNSHGGFENRIILDSTR